jgi:hypothetical protein
MDRLVFMLDMDAEAIAIPLSEIIDLEFGSRQGAFRRRIQESGLVTRPFSSPAELGQLVERSLRELAGTQRRISSGIQREGASRRPEILLADLWHAGQDARSGQLGWPGCCLRPFLLPCPSSRSRNRVCHVYAACRLAGAGSADRRGDRVDVRQAEDAAAAGGADP